MQAMTLHADEEVNMNMTEFLTPEQVAERLQLSLQTVWRYLRDGKLSAARIGRQYRITEEDLEAFVRQAREPGPANGNGDPEAEEEELSAEDLAAVRRGLEDIQAGRVKSLKDLRRDLEL